MSASPQGSGTNAIPTPEEFLTELNARVAAFLQDRRTRMSEFAPEAGSLIEGIEHLSTGGKRLRALLCYWGWRAGSGAPESVTALSRAAQSIELFHTAALIHDDIIDHSDTRRRGPSSHRRFEALLADGQSRDRERFGTAAAILAGDLCLSLSEEVFASIPLPVDHKARRIFDQMRWEVMAGQYLDVWEQTAGAHGHDAANASERAHTILLYKSAKYSTQRPFELGGAIAGVDEALLHRYAEFALPLGEAFQLSDDVLGVFGDPDTTGKPAGDDLRHGKRTVLLAYARAMATPQERAFIDAHLGDADMSTPQLERMCELLEHTGAKQRVETHIQELTDRAQNALLALPLDPRTSTALQELSRQLAGREA